MTHPDESALLLYSYDELPDAEAAELERHLATCPACQDQLRQLDQAAVLMDIVLKRRASSGRRLAHLTAWLAVAATVAVVVVQAKGPSEGRGSSDTPVRATAGYLTGGADLIAVDSILGRLEQEVSHAKQ